MSIGDWTGLIGLVMGVVTFLGGLIAWYKGSVEKRYASQRDFNHLRRNQEAISSLLESLAKEIESLARTVEDTQSNTETIEHEFSDYNRNFVEVKALILSVSQRLEWLSARIDGVTSSGWMKPPTS